MKYRKVLIIVLPILVISSIVGVGFSSWYFGHEDLKVTNNNISVYTASDVTKGTLSIINKCPSKVVFSQGKGETDNLKDGINYYSIQDDNISYLENDEITLKYSLKDKNDSISGSYFKLYVTFGGKSFSNYVKLADKYTNATDTLGGYDFSSDIQVVTDTSSEDPYGYFKYTLNLSNVIEYKNVDVKPFSNTKYQNLKTALADASISVKFVVI